MSLSCHGISKVFHTDSQDEADLLVLEDISLTLEANEFVCIVGPSGCGKSTLLRIIMGIEKASAGELYFAAQSSKDLPQIVMVFQQHNVYPWLNVLDNVLFGIQTPKLSRSEKLERAMDAIHKVKLDNFEHYYPSQLSGGMRQRVGIARAFAADADILLMDEPFGALDAQTKLVLQQELLNIWQQDKKTVLYVTHDIDEAILLADRIVVMSHRPGNIQAILPVNIMRPRMPRDIDAPELREMRWDIWNMLKIS